MKRVLHGPPKLQKWCVCVYIFQICFLQLWYQQTVLSKTQCCNISLGQLVDFSLVLIGYFAGWENFTTRPATESSLLKHVTLIPGHLEMSKLLSWLIELK